MSYDIHGNPLKNGYCEVHPWVAEYYPCSICDIESRKINERDLHMQNAEIEWVKYQEKEKLIDNAISICQNIREQDKEVIISILNTLRNY